MGPGLKSGIKLRLDNPAQLGAELLCGAVAALAECSGPLVVISADTAISLMAVNAEAGACGRRDPARAAAFAERTGEEHRPAAPDRPCRTGAPASILGKSTSACLQNGFVLGTASLLDGLADRFCAELGPQTAFYATGNLPTRHPGRLPHPHPLPRDPHHGRPVPHLDEKQKGIAHFARMNGRPLVRHSYRLGTAG